MTVTCCLRQKFTFSKESMEKRQECSDYSRFWTAEEMFAKIILNKEFYNIRACADRRSGREYSCPGDFAYVPSRISMIVKLLKI